MTPRQCSLGILYWSILGPNRTSIGVWLKVMTNVLKSDLKKSRVCPIWDPIWPPLEPNLPSLFQTVLMVRMLPLNLITSICTIFVSVGVFRLRHLSFRVLWSRLLVYMYDIRFVYVCVFLRHLSFRVHWSRLVIKASLNNLMQSTATLELVRGKLSNIWYVPQLPSGLDWCGCVRLRHK